MTPSIQDQLRDYAVRVTTQSVSVDLDEIVSSDVLPEPVTQTVGAWPEHQIEPIVSTRRRGWLVAAAAAVVVLVLVGGGASWLSRVTGSDTPVADIVASTTASLPTTTVWRGVTYPATVLQAEVRSFCEQGAAMGPGMRLKSFEEWMASFDGTAIFGFGGSVVDHISVEAAHARNAKDLRLAAVLESVSEDLTNALSVMGNASKAGDGDIYLWTRQMFRVERLCALAEGTISTLVSVGEE